MKKIKFGSIELLGYTGGLIWVAVNFLWGMQLSDDAGYWLLLGILPNYGRCTADNVFCSDSHEG